MVSVLALAQNPGTYPNIPALNPNLPPAQPGPASAERFQVAQRFGLKCRFSGTPHPGTSNSPMPDTDYTIRTTTRTVFVPTTIKDKDTGSFVNGLSVSDFTVFDNDRPQKTFRLSYEPLSIVVAIQSNSDVEPMIPKLKKVGGLLRGLVTGEGGDIAIIEFDHRIEQLQDWTSDAGRIDDSLQKLYAGSSTARTIDAVLEADRMLKRHDPQKQAPTRDCSVRPIDKGSESKSDETLRQMQFDNVVVYPIDISQITLLEQKPPTDARRVMGGVPPEAMHSPTGNTQTGTDVLQNHPGGNAFNIVPPVWRSIKDLFKAPPDKAFAGLTGGRVYTFARQSSLEQAMSDLGKELHSQYLLSYSPDAETEKEPGFHKIRVEVNHPRLDIRARTGYYWGGGVQ